QLNHPVIEAFDGAQLQGDVAVTPRDEWNAVANEHRGDRDHELVDRAGVEKRGDELTAAHQPHVLARLFSEPIDVWADFAGHELHAWWDVGWWRLTREDDGSILR